MSGHKPFSELTKDFSPERVKLVQKQAAALRETMALADLRKALEITQSELASALGVDQSAVTKMERRGDMHVSNLRRLIEGLGGEMEIHAKFPQGDVKIENVGSS